MSEISMFYIMGPTVGIFTVIIVWLIYAYIMPAKNSPAWSFITAKKKKMPLFLMDCGSYWKIMIGKNEGPGFVEDSEGSKIDITPNSLKGCMGVRLAVGEYYRSLTSNPMIVKLIDYAEKHKVKAKELKEGLESMSQEIYEEGKSETEQPMEKEEKSADVEPGTTDSGNEQSEIPDS